MAGLPSASAMAGNGARRSVVATGRLLDGRYQIERLLGAGGMATVWCARDLRLDRQVAVKEVSGDGLRQPKALERFEREARAVGRLQHPNVVSVYDVAAQDGVPYLVMEMVEGPTVAQLLADGPLPVADVLAVAVQVCDGLAAAHAAGVIHRDVKPANLILTTGGVAKICDFGVARLVDSVNTGNLTGPATAMGSPSFMAPEQINGEAVDPRTDLYGLGCTLYAMLTGEPPFTAGGPLGIVHQHITTPPQPLRLRRPEVPPAVEALVAELLAKAPDERPPDAATVGARITAAQADPAAVAPSTLLRSAVAARVEAARAARAHPWAGVEPRSSTHPESPAPTRKLRPRAVAAVGAAALIAAVVAVAVPLVVSGAGDDVARWSTPGPAMAAPLTPSPVVSVTSAAPSSAARPATASRSPAAPTGSASPAPPVDPIVTLRQVIGQQVASGGLKPDAANDLNHMVDDLSKTIATGNTGEVANKIKALRDKLTTLNREGKLSDDGYRILNSAVDQVAAAQG
jgi:serine/threonine-protein kinase